MSTLQLFDSAGKLNLEIVKTHFYDPLKGIPGKISTTRLVFIPPEQNTDFDNAYTENDQLAFNENKIAIIKAMRTFEIKRLASLHKGNYKSEISQINSMIGQVNQNAIEIASILGSLNENASVAVVLDGIDQEGHVVEDVREIILTKKDLLHIIKMVKQLNRDFKDLIRGSKGKSIDRGAEGAANSTPSPLITPGNLSKNREKLYQINSIVVDNLFAQINQFQPNDDFDPMIDDTMGIKIENIAVHPTFTTSKKFFSLSEAFSRGFMKGSTFTNALTLLSYNFRISQWYSILLELGDPLIYIRKEKEEGKNVAKEDVVYVYDKDNKLIDEDKDMYYYITKDPSENVKEFKEKIKAVKEGIKSNISHLPMEKLQEYLDQIKVTKLNGIDRDMIALDIFSMEESASNAYFKDEKGIHLTRLKEDDKMTAIEALEVKPRFDPDNITTANFTQFLNVTGIELDDVDIKQTSEKFLKMADDDAEKIQEFTKQMAEARKEYAKLFMINYIKEHLQLQIAKLNQVGAIVGTK